MSRAWLSVVELITGITVIAVISGVAMLVVALLARFQPRLLGLPADGDEVLFWAEKPSMVDKADLLQALEAQCKVKTVTEDAVKVEGELDLRELAHTINFLIARQA